MFVSTQISMTYNWPSYLPLDNVNEEVFNILSKIIKDPGETPPNPFAWEIRCDFCDQRTENASIKTLIKLNNVEYDYQFIVGEKYTNQNFADLDIKIYNHLNLIMQPKEEKTCP